MKRCLMLVFFLTLMIFPLSATADSDADTLDHSIAILQELGAHIEKDANSFDFRSQGTAERKIPSNGTSYALLDEQNRIIKIDRINETNAAAFRNNTPKKDYRTTQAFIEKEIIKSGYKLIHSGYFDDTTLYLRYEKTKLSDGHALFDAYDVYIDTQNGALVSLKKKHGEKDKAENGERDEISKGLSLAEKSVHTFYLHDVPYVKLRDFSKIINEKKADGVFYDQQTGTILINMEKHKKGKEAVQSNPVKDEASKRAIKSTNKVIMRSHSEPGKDIEAKGLQMVLVDGSNYVSAHDLCALYGVSMTHEDGSIVLDFDQWVQNDFKKWQLNNQTIQSRDLNLEYMTDAPQKAKFFKLFGQTEEKVLQIIAQNITNEEPRDLLKNAPGEGSLILTMHDQENEVITFMFIPYNKIDGKYYVAYRRGNQAFQCKYLKTNVIEDIWREMK